MKRKQSPNQLKNLKPIRKGEIRNPKGINADPEMKAIKKLTAFELKELGSVMIRKDLKELKRLGKGPTGVSWLIASTAAIAVKAQETGDDKKWNAILDRIVGKVPFVAEVSGPSGGPIVTGNMSEEEILKRQLALDTKLAETEDE